MTFADLNEDNTDTDLLEATTPQELMEELSWTWDHEDGVALMEDDVLRAHLALIEPELLRATVAHMKALPVRDARHMLQFLVSTEIEIERFLAQAN